MLAIGVVICTFSILFMIFYYTVLFSDKFVDTWMFWSVGEFYAFDGCSCIECLEQFCVEMDWVASSMVVFSLNSGGCEVLSKGVSS